MPAPMIACVHIPRFAVEVERQRQEDAGTRLILIGEGTVFDCSLGADASGVRRGMRMSEGIGRYWEQQIHRARRRLHNQTWSSEDDFAGWRGRFPSAAFDRSPAGR